MLHSLTIGKLLYDTLIAITVINTEPTTKLLTIWPNIEKEINLAMMKQLETKLELKAPLNLHPNSFV